MQLIDGGLEELCIEEDCLIAYCDYMNFKNMQQKLEDLGVQVESSELSRIPNSLKKLNLDQAKKVLRLIDLLQENDDVQQVFHNMEITDEMLNLMEN